MFTLANGVSPLLAGELDLGEAAVIQLALDLPGATVVLDDLKAGIACCIQSLDREKEGIALGWEDVRDLRAGATVTKTFPDDIPPDGAVQRTIECQPPSSALTGRRTIGRPGPSSRQKSDDGQVSSMQNAADATTTEDELMQ